MTIENLLRVHAPHAPSSLRSRVLAIEPRRTPPRRLVLVVAVALLAAVAAAVVDGIVTSSPKKQQQTALRAAVPAAPKAFGQATTPLTGGSGGAALSGTVHGSLPSAAAARLQQVEATLELRVQSPSSATTKATRIATSLGGYAQSINYSSRPGVSSVILRVPAQNVKSAVARLEALGTVVSQNLSVTDLQHDLQQETAQIAQLRATVAALEKALRNSALPDAQRVILQIRLANAKRALSQRLHARTGTIAAGTSASIALTLETKQSVGPVPHHRGRLGRMLHSAVGFLGLEGTVALYALIVLSPAALGAALVWSLREARRRRDERLVME
jgi:hypothetical protein